MVNNINCVELAPNEAHVRFVDYLGSLHRYDVDNFLLNNAVLNAAKLNWLPRELGQHRVAYRVVDNEL